MGLVGATCPNCGASTYLTVPAGRTFVGTERDASARDGLVEDEGTCEHCGARFPFVHGPA
jgi:ribosomal protein S27AE